MQSGVSCQERVLMLRWCVIGLMLFAAAAARAEDNWPEFRGPHANGHADSGNPPTHFSETENVRWKTAIHDKGWSSPVVWGKQIWLTTATEAGHKQYAICVDRETGKVQF